MARGGFHGGGFHSGGHHGGFSGGGFHGGGFHGGFHGGYYGGRNGSDENESYRFFSTIVVLSICLIGFLIDKAYEGNIPGLDYYNLILFFISLCFFIWMCKENGRTSVLSKIRKGTGSSGSVWKGESPNFRVGNYHTWYDTTSSQYCISFYEKSFGDSNAEKVKETMARTPKIVWMSPYVWTVLGGIFFICTFFFYELVIPVFENRVMTDQAFNFMDNFIFYLPSVLTLLCAVSGFIMLKIRDNLLYKCAYRIVHDNIAAEERMKTESIIASKLSSKWYYNRCPNCGAEASKALRICTHCGASLEVKSFEDGISGAIHRISKEDEENKED